LVLNHGLLGQVGKISEADPQQWKETFDVNFISLVAFVWKSSYRLCMHC
jgi:NADP-dependent 3-hydroxy acid dehydrogenase YdfG